MVAFGTLKPKRGFTLVELLVVIAIIGILVGLLLPAVQAAREAARRMSCSNNLKQMGLAVHNFHDTHGNLPPGYGWNNAANKGNWKKTWSWSAFILPFMEQGNLADRLGVTSGEFDTLLPGNNSSSWPAAGVALIQTKLPMYRCPSDTGPDINTTVDFCHSGGPNTTKPATSNYAAVYAYQYSSWNAGGSSIPVTHGAFGWQNGFNLGSITDGTSNTFLIGERGWAHQAAYWVGVGNTNSEDTWSSPKAVGRSFIHKINCPITGRYYSAYSSYHTGGAQFVFADGSVHFISDSIEFSNGSTTAGQPWGWWVDYGDINKSTLGVYQRLGLRDDGMPVNANL